MAIVWITRISGEASAKAVAALGASPLIAPLLKLCAASTPASAPPDDNVIAFTSGSAVRAFAALTDRRHWRAYAIGDATAALAVSLGFENTLSASGDVNALAALIIKDAPKNALGAVTYLSGVHIAGDLMGALDAAGIRASREIIYATHPVTQMPERAADALINEDNITVLLYSPKGARAFAALINSPQFAANIPKLITVSLSANIDAALGGLALMARHIADAPNEAALISALETALAKA